MKLLATDYDGTLRYAQDVMPEDLKSVSYTHLTLPTILRV